MTAGKPSPSSGVFWILSLDPAFYDVLELLSSPSKDGDSCHIGSRHIVAIQRFSYSSVAPQGIFTPPSRSSGVSSTCYPCPPRGTITPACRLQSGFIGQDYCAFARYNCWTQPEFPIFLCGNKNIFLNRHKKSSDFSPIKCPYFPSSNFIFQLYFLFLFHVFFIYLFIFYFFLFYFFF